MPDAPTPIAGRCHCGAVRFRLTPPTDFVAHCHCESCRLTHAAPLVTWTSVPTDRFTLAAGAADHLTWYRSSEWIEWGFCSNCGTSALYRAIAEGHPESPSPQRVYVAAATLTDPLDRPPKVHVSYEEKGPWLAIPDGLPKHRGKTNETLPE